MLFRSLNAANPQGLVFREGHQTPFGSFDAEVKLWSVPKDYWDGQPLNLVPA